MFRWFYLPLIPFLKTSSYAPLDFDRKVPKNVFSKMAAIFAKKSGEKTLKYLYQEYLLVKIDAVFFIWTSLKSPKLMQNLLITNFENYFRFYWKIEIGRKIGLVGNSFWLRRLIFGMRDPRDDKSSHSISFSKILIFDLLMAIFSFFF